MSNRNTKTYLNENWPPDSRVKIYSENGTLLIQSSKRKRFDLSDQIMQYRDKRKVVLAVSTKSKKWDIWSEETLTAVENYISYDFGFDGFYVKFKRLKGILTPCSEEALWELDVSVEYD